MASFGVTHPTTRRLSKISSILNSDNTSQFETLISDLLSPANYQRSEAATLFNLGKKHHPNALVLKLCHLLPVSSKRAMYAVLLRDILTVDPSSGADGIYKHLSGDTKSALKQTLIECVHDETNKSVRKKVCDTVSELAAIIVPGHGWPMLLSYMFQWVTSDIDRHRESALLLFAQLVQYIGGLLVPRLEKLHQAFLECLDSGMVADVRIAAFTASINFIRYLEKASDRDKFHDLIPLMMQTLNEALVWNESTPRESMLNLLIELAGTETFVYEGIDEVVEAMLQIAEAENLEEGTKHLALEFVVTLAEAREGAPAMINELSQLVKRLFEVLMKMLLDVEDDPDWHRAEIEHEDAGETNNYSAGKEYLDRLSISLGGNTIVPVIFEIFPAYLAAPDQWQKHHAALIALAQIAEGCSKVMTRNELEQVVSMILNSFQDPHPRARWAAINAIGQLSTDRYHHLVLPALASAMDDFHNPRLQVHATSMVLNFSKNCPPRVLQPYLDGIVGKLLVLLQNTNHMIQEGALTALASVGGSSQVHFENYYDAVMPYLRDILVNANDNANQMLCAKSMVCICLVGMAVEFDKFKDDVKLVINVLQGSQLEANDLTISLLLQSWAGYQEYYRHTHKCPEQAFLLYLCSFMRCVLKRAQHKRFMRWKECIILTNPDAHHDEHEIQYYMSRYPFKRVGPFLHGRIYSRAREEASPLHVLFVRADLLLHKLIFWSCLNSLFQCFHDRTGPAGWTSRAVTWRLYRSASRYWFRLTQGRPAGPGTGGPVGNRRSGSLFFGVFFPIFLFFFCVFFHFLKNL